MSIQPSQPADVEFVDEGEQEEVLKGQNISVQKVSVAQHDLQDEIELDIFDERPKQTQQQSGQLSQFTINENNNQNKGNKIEQEDIENLSQAKDLTFKSEKKKKTRTDGWSLFERYTCMLNLTDISYGQKGHNKFYKIEVLHKGYTIFSLYTKWGRVGAQNPQESYKQMDNKYDAILSFKKKFYDKSHNDWTGNFSDFKQQPGKYTWIQVETSGLKGSVNEDIEVLNARNQELKRRMETTPTTLSKDLATLMSLIWDFNRIKRTLKELNFDTEKNPLGKLTFEQIQKGYKILTEIQNGLMSNARTSIIIELTNQFYTNIPQNYGMKALPMIDHITKVKEKLHLLDVLKELDITNRYLNQALTQNSNINPLDTFYSILKCTIKTLNNVQNSEELSIIQDMVNNTHGPTHSKYKLQLLNVFQLDRYAEEQRFYPFKFMPNKTLLWHGSRISNFVGILSEGLRIAPPEAPMTGYMFGKGIYLADVISKAASYCHAKPESPEGLLILCEAALGNVFPINRAKNYKVAPTYHHSVKGVGKMKTANGGEKKLGSNHCFTGNVVESDEVGDGQPKELVYNEYVLYDVAQVRMKYLIRVNFVFSS